MTLPEIADYRACIPHLDPREDPESSWFAWRGHQIQVLRRPNPRAPVRVLVVHGAGAHSRALWPIIELLDPALAELSSVDLPLYGATVSPDPAAVTYREWLELLADFLAAESDGRPLILLGASIGGMISVEVAARTGAVTEVIATCLLDPRDPRALAKMTRFGPFGLLARLVPPLGRLSRIRIPIGWVARLSRMSHNPTLVQLCQNDPRGGAARVPLGFLLSYTRHRHIPPEEVKVPVTLAHPACDTWTPASLSLRWLHRCTAPTRVVFLTGCGHFPIEEPGLGELISTVAEVCRRNS